MAGAKGRRWTCGSRPCSACRRWFTPDPRARGRQKVCKRAECKKERHRRACARWREANPDYDREDRLRRKVRPADSAGSPGRSPPQMNWQAVRDAVGLEVAVVIEEAGQMLLEQARDAVPAQVPATKGEPRQMPPSVARDDMAASARPP